MLAAMGSGSAAVSAEVELCVIRLGPCGLVAVNAEAFCDFTAELAVIITRSRHGETAVYPVVETVQRDRRSERLA